MKNIALLLSFGIGAMSIVAGGKALLGSTPTWTVLAWLPVYNFVMGVLTVAIPTILIWRNSPHAMTAAIVTLSMHALVTVLLLTVFRSAVATESILAMVMRSTVWAAIIALLYFSRK